MKTMMALFLFVFTLGAHQVASNDCCVADQFTAGFAVTCVLSPNHESQSCRVRINGDAAMDYTGHRYAFNQTWHLYDEKLSFNMRYIDLYNEGSSYMIFNYTQCYKGSLWGTEPYQCLPDNAYPEDTVFFGKNSLELDSWKMRFEEKGEFYGDLRFATTRANCIPVVSSLIAKAKSTHGEYDHFVEDGVLFNYTTGLDPSSFTVPDICNNTSQKPKDKTVELLDKWNVLRKGMVFF